jgi:hypothetical protein
MNYRKCDFCRMEYAFIPRTCGICSVTLCENCVVDVDECISCDLRKTPGSCISRLCFTGLSGITAVVYKKPSSTSVKLLKCNNSYNRLFDYKSVPFYISIFDGNTFTRDLFKRIRFGKRMIKEIDGDEVKLIKFLSQAKNADLN